jgi:hypothetical protein
MKTLRISFPLFGLVAVTRALLGAGIALLLADHLVRDQRKAAGWTLVLIGVLTSIPLGLEVLGRRDEPGTII